MRLIKAGSATARELIPAVIAEIRRRSSAPSKTRLLKILYLIDLESYRKRRETFTNWSWKFYRFGPWASEYDQALGELAQRSRVLVSPLPSNVDVSLLEPGELEYELGDFAGEIQNLVQRVLTRWADQPLAKILDYVYFETEPMANARRGERLDFESVWEKPFVTYRRRRGDVTGQVLAEMRHRVRGLVAGAQSAQSQLESYTAPRYDEEALRGFAALADD